jgi:putative glutamine amidotransferase
MRPLIGISCCVKSFGVFHTPNHAASESYVRVVLGPVGGLPVLLPAAGDCLANELLPQLDGLLLTGSRSNVCPAHYDGPPHAEGTPEDHARDSTTLPLIRAAIAAGVPVLAICRGMQELNVALGGSLDQAVHLREGGLDHRADGAAPVEVQYGTAHTIALVPGGMLAEMLGCETLPVNSVHEQGMRELAPRLRAEAHACDGLVESVSVTDAAGFALGVQWHPEWQASTNPASLRLLQAFGDACRARRLSKSPSVPRAGE